MGGRSALKAGDINAAYKIWYKLIFITEADGSKFWKDVTERNWSAFHNYFVLSMLLANNGKYNAVVGNLYFLESEFCQKFVSTITDSTFKIAAKELQIDFLNKILQEIDQKTVNITLNDLLANLQNIDFSAKEDFIARFVSKKVEYIESKIKETKEKRKNNKGNAAQAGKELYKSINSVLIFLKDTFGTNNIKYSSIADKASGEILQCGIDYFIHYRDTDTDPSKVSMDLFKGAAILAVGDYAKERCREQTEELQKWIDDKPVRDKLQVVDSDIAFITAKLEAFKEDYDVLSFCINNPNEVIRKNIRMKSVITITGISKTRDLIDNCKPKLVNIKNALSSTDEFYLMISGAVVNSTQNMLVTAVNAAQVQFGMNQISFQDLKEIVNEAYNAQASMQSMDMLFDLRQQFRKNFDALANIRNQINNAGSRSSGCYIATMVYGDYDHPQVLILRKFRDDTLSKSLFGRWFIKIYYRYSPRLVEYLKDKKAIAITIRGILNQFIKVISK